MLTFDFSALENEDFKEGVSFNDIVFQVIPLTKNGIQANNKSIRELLGEIAYEDKSSRKWRLKDEELSLFDDKDWQ